MSNTPEMNRKDFLQLFGMGAAALVASACLGSCGGNKSSDPVPGVSGVDFTVDLTAASSAALDNPATGYIYGPNRNVIVAKTTAGTYVALQAPCPHQGTSVYFNPSSNQFICPNHNAIFTTTGSGVSGPTTGGLKQYAVAQAGSMLRITG